MKSTLTALLLSSLVIAAPNNPPSSICTCYPAPTTLPPPPPVTPTPTPSPTPAPLCPAFPWFIAPKTGSDCGSPSIAVQPNSGYASNPRSAHCEYLDPANKTVFKAVDTTIACGGWKVTFYDASDPTCAGAGTSVEAKETCLTGGQYLKFSAVKI